MACSDDTVRPDTDYVEVFAPKIASYDVKVTYWIDVKDSAMSENIKAAVYDAVSSWVLWQKSALGRDINPSELIRRIMTAGVKRCVVDSPNFTVLKNNQVAISRYTIVIYGGLEEG